MSDEGADSLPGFEYGECLAKFCVEDVTRQGAVSSVVGFPGFVYGAVFTSAYGEGLTPRAMRSGFRV